MRPRPRGKLGYPGFGFSTDYAKRALGEVREIDARRVFLWEVQPDEYPAYLAMPDTPRLQSHGHYLAVIAALQADVERKGTQVVRVCVPVATMIAELARRGWPNDTKHRAKVIGELGANLPGSMDPGGRWSWRPAAAGGIAGRQWWGTPFHEEFNCIMTNYIQLPDVRIQPPREDLEGNFEPLGKLLLFSKGTTVKEGHIRAGRYGIPEGETVIDLGNAVDIIPLARRLKAVDMSNVDAAITAYDFESPEFNRIFTQSWERDGNCMWGTSFLIFERSSHRFLEFFCGTKSTRAEAGEFTPFLPLTIADIDCQAKYYGRDVSRLVPHGPMPLTLRSRRIKKGSYSGYAPVVTECSVPFTDLPSPNDMVKEIQRFIDESMAEWWTRLLSRFQNNQRAKGKAEPSGPASDHQRKLPHRKALRPAPVVSVHWIR